MKTNILNRREIEELAEKALLAVGSTSNAAEALARAVASAEMDGI